MVGEIISDGEVPCGIAVSMDCRMMAFLGGVRLAARLKYGWSVLPLPEFGQDHLRCRYIFGSPDRYRCAFSGYSYGGMDSRCACRQGTRVNDVHLLVLSMELITASGTRGVSNFEGSHGNVVGYALGRGLAEARGVVIKH